MSDSDSLLYTCGCRAAGPVAQAGRSRISGAIDLHCHLVTPRVGELVASRPEVTAMLASMPALMGKRSFERNIDLDRANLRLVAPAARIADMDAMGTAIQVLSPDPRQYHYWADRHLAEQLVAVQNEHIASLCAAHPDRFLGLGMVAMQHPDLAQSQLDQLMQKGFKGIEISSRIGERELSDPVFDRLWGLAAETGAVVFIHPLGSSLGARLADDYLANTVGQPVETTIALSQLIFSGVLDRHPALKIVAAHGGGYLPGFAGRSDHAHSVRPESQRCVRPPSDYLQRIWYDTVVHSPAVLANLLAVVGASQIVVGSDYPYDMGEYRLAALLDAVPAIAKLERAAIISGNARRLLGLEARVAEPSV